MKAFDNLMSEFKERIPDMEFHEILRQARNTIGLMQYRVAENVGVGINRLKNLETGYFRTPIDPKELQRICYFYELPLPLMNKKMQDHLDKHVRQRKMRIMDRGQGSLYDL